MRVFMLFFYMHYMHRLMERLERKVAVFLKWKNVFVFFLFYLTYFTFICLVFFLIFRSYFHKLMAIYWNLLWATQFVFTKPRPKNNFKKQPWHCMTSLKILTWLDSSIAKQPKWIYAMLGIFHNRWMKR